MHGMARNGIMLDGSALTKKLEAQWAESVSFTFYSVLKKLYTEPGASSQISFNLAKYYRGLFFNWRITNKNCLWQPLQFCIC
jgi:hypothetical protein